jgi:hypothetical protein
MLARIDLQRGAAQNFLRAIGFVYVSQAKQHLKCCDLSQLWY